MIGFICFLIFLALFSSWITFRWTHRKMFNNIKNLTELENYPLIGSAHLFFGLTAEDTFKLFVEQVSKLTSPTKFWFCSKLTIVLDDPEDIHKVLTSPYCLEKGAVYENFINEYGLITSKPHIWKPSRKHLTSTFSITMLRTFLTIFNENSKDLVNDLESKCGQEEFDIFDNIGKSALDLQMRTSFGTRFNKSNLKLLYNNVTELLHIYAERFVKIHTQIGFKILKNTKFYKRENEMTHELYQIYNPLTIQTRADYIKEIQKKDASTVDEEFNKKPEILIKRLVQLEHKGLITDPHIKDHINTMMLAGGDTLAISTSTIILCLAMYPDVQEKVVNELREIIGTKEDIIDFDTVSNLKYLDMVCKEALRIIPTVPLVARKCSKDIELPSCTIPSGTDIFIMILNLHRRKDIWGSEAEKFNPDNFLPENIEKRHKLAHIPFSYGPRNCIAMKYAILSLRITISRLVMSYKFSTHLKLNELKLGFGITTQILNKHMVKLEKRIF